MASIINELNKMRTAVYGEEVRSAIYQACLKLSNQMDNDILSELDSHTNDLTEIRNMLSQVGADFYVDEENKLLYLVNMDGEPISAGITVPSSGGGGGGGSSATYTQRIDPIGDTVISVTKDATALLRFTYTSVDGEGNDDGPGIGTISMGGVVRRTFTVTQGTNSVDVSSLLSPGVNNIIVKVENSDMSIKSRKFTVNLITLSVSTTFEPIATYSGDVSFNYTLVGAGEKTVHYKLDGVEIDTEQTTSTGRSRSYLITEQAHGSHIFECYATADIDGTSVESNHIVLSMVWVDPTNSTPIIASTFMTTAVVQGSTISIPYMVYDPTTETATVTLSVIDSNNDTVSTQTITKGRDIGDPWILVDYPAGNVTFRISCRSVNKDFMVAVEEYQFPIDKITDGLMFEFSPAGRSNAEANPASWSNGDYSATFTGFGWSTADGWLRDSNNSPIFRLLPGNTMSINAKLFEGDARNTGFAIEAEIATRDVRDFNSIVMSCFNGGRGFKIASQSAILQSEQSSVSMLFKEDSHVRIMFTVENRNLNRLIYIYVNGKMCGATQYPVNDNFAQSEAQNLTIGAQSCGLDIYRIRAYRKQLNRNEQLDNFIVDRPTLSERQQAYNRNDLLNSSEEVDIEKLPITCPYMILKCPELPQYKGDKKDGCEVEFVDRINTAKGFVASNVQIDVQGTSSSVYPVKNEKIKVKGGFVVNGETSSKYALNSDCIPVSTFTIKVDYASSEGANNVELVDLYETICREQGWLTPPQVENTKVRQGIAGRPIVLFWQNTITNVVSFIGKANFNLDKGTSEAFGFDDYPNAQSVEFKNNTSDICLFKGQDWTSTSVDDQGNTYPSWQDDLEFRYPEDNTDTTGLQRVWTFVINHDRSTVNTDAAKEEMLTDFKTHFEEYFVKNNMLFYYLFTELFLMVDSRAKNMFLTTYDGTHWLPLPYDMDTACGINNEGALAFEYNLEDTDTVGGSIVFNGQSSVLWQNIRDAFKNELKAMYITLRSGLYFNYNYIRNKFKTHQDTWPERIWNEDAFKKYLQPYLIDNRNYLDKLLGDKGSHFDWWCFGAFNYRDSKYSTGTAKSNRIILRGYIDGDPNDPNDEASIAAQIAAANITVTPYDHMYASVMFGSYTLSHRMERNESYTFVNPMSYMNDTEIYIDSADRLSNVGDLSVLRLGKVADFSAATKLQQLVVGSSDNGYRNTYLQSLNVGNNELLTLVNVCNCTALVNPIDLSGCTAIETVLASGSSITGVNLPIGGHLKRIDLPATIANLTVRNQLNLITVNIAGYTNITTLRIENTPNIPIEAILTGATSLNRVRLLGVEWTATDETALTSCIDRLDNCIGMDVNGNNTAKAVVIGRVNVSSISATLLERIQTDYPDLVVVVNGTAQYIVKFFNYDNTLIYSEVVAEGSDAVNPVTAGFISAPTRTNTDTIHYTFTDFGTLPTNVHANGSVIAQYSESYRVRYLSDAGGSAIQTTYVDRYGSTQYNGSTPTKASTAQYTYTFANWSGATNTSTGAINNVTEAKDIVATYTATTRSYPISFVNDNNASLWSGTFAYGVTPTYGGTTPTSSDSSMGAFQGWTPALAPVTGAATYKATYQSPVEDAEISGDWASIIDAVIYGTYDSAYKIGNYKALDLGTESTVDMQIVAKNGDIDADNNTAPLTFISKQLLATSNNMNSTKTTTGGYPASAMKTYMNSTILGLIPSVVKLHLKAVIKTSRDYNGGSPQDLTTNETLWIPSYREIFGGTSYEQTGVIYNAIYKGNTSRIKAKVGGSSTYWWLRSASDSTSFRCVYSSGNGSYDTAGYTFGVALGFSLAPDTIHESWEEISGAISDGTYTTKYAIGDTKAVDMGDQGIICFQIVAFDADVDENGNTIPITWVSQQILATSKRMNASNTTSGGYPASEMKTTIAGYYDRLPSTLKSMIVAASKTSRDYNGGTPQDLTTNETLWIPSYREIFGGTSYEQTGPIYSGVFSSSSTRIKKRYGTGSSARWWLRSASGSSNFSYVTNDGGYFDGDASGTIGVALGFCTKAIPT